MKRLAFLAPALLLVGCNALALNSATTTASSTVSSIATPSPVLSTVQSFAIQLHNVGENGPVDSPNITTISNSRYDVVAIDEVTTSNLTNKLSAQQILSQIHNTVGQSGTRKLVLAYLDVGEAENNRTYWQQWTIGNPTFVLGADPNGSKNKFAVNISDPHWQAIVFGSPGALVDQAIADGFDGAYLDTDGAFNFSIVQNADPSASGDMVTFLSAVAAYVKTRSPNFLIVLANGAPLTTDSRYIAALNAEAETGIFFTSSLTQVSDVQQDAATTSTLETLLQRVQAANKPVFSIDYATSPANVEQAYGGGSAYHYIEYVTSSALASLATPPPTNINAFSKRRLVQ